MDIAAIHSRMRAAAGRLRLPPVRVSQGRPGAWNGSGTGSSTDFHDHRPYIPGDDPRAINWQAYGRTGQYTMKLYREEISPLFEIILDASPSMLIEPAKAVRTIELFYFLIENALVTGAPLRAYWLPARGVEIPLTVDQLRSHRLPPLSDPAAVNSSDPPPALAPRLARLPRRPGSHRILVSDLLFPEPPAETLRLLSDSRGRALILAPGTQAEADPDWSGGVEFLDCESTRSRRQRATPDLVERYRQAHARHLALWREESRRHGVTLARVPAEPEFDPALRHEAIPAGAVEYWR